MTFSLYANTLPRMTLAHNAWSLIKALGPADGAMAAAKIITGIGQEVLAHTSDGVRFASPNDRSLFHHLTNSTAKIEAIVGCIAPDAKTIVDLGGNVGLFSLLAARRCPNADIFCYEPDPSLAKIARRNLKSQPRVTVIECAVAASRGTATFFTSRQSNQIGSLERGAVTTFDSHPRETTVQTIPVADVFSGFDAIDFLKVDIQGGEWAAFSADQGKCLQKVQAAVFEITFLDPATLELAELLRREFLHYRPMHAVHSGADVFFWR